MQHGGNAAAIFDAYIRSAILWRAAELARALTASFIKRKIGEKSLLDFLEL